MNFQSTRIMRDVANIVSICFWEVPNLGLLLRWIGFLNLQTKLVSMEEHFGGVQDSNSPCQFLADVFCIYLDLFKKSRLLIFCRTPFLAFWPLFRVLHYHTTTFGNMNWMWGIKFECLYGDEWMNDKLMWAQLNSRQGIKSLEGQELGAGIDLQVNCSSNMLGLPKSCTLVAVTWMILYWFVPRSVEIYLQIMIQCVTTTVTENFQSQKVNSTITTTAVFSDFPSCSHTARQPPTCWKLGLMGRPFMPETCSLCTNTLYC